MPRSLRWGLVGAGDIASSPGASGARQVVPPQRRSPYEVSLEAFPRATESAGQPVVGGVEGLRADAVALAAGESARTGRAADVQTDRP